MKPIELLKINDLEIQIACTFEVSRQKVFECFTRPDLLKLWMVGPEDWTFKECKVDLRVRGKFHFVWQNEEGVRMGVTGVYKEVKVPEKLIYTELVDGFSPSSETLTTLTLEEKYGQTKLKNTIKYQSKSIRDKALEDNLEAGLSFLYHRIETLCEED